MLVYVGMLALKKKIRGTLFTARGKEASGQNYQVIRFPFFAICLRNLKNKVGSTLNISY